MAGGGVILRQFSQTFTSSGSWTAPDNLASPPGVYCQGSGGKSTGGGSSVGAGGGGGGAFGGEPALGGVSPGTVLTVTVDTSGGQASTNVTGGSVTVQGNSGKNNSGTSTGGAGGTAGTNTIAFAGGKGGNATATDGGGGGGGGSGGSTGAGGNAANNSGTSSSAGGSAGTGAAGPPSLAGVAGAASGGFDANGNNGATPGAGAGGPGALISTTANGGGGQVVIVWYTLTAIPAPIPRRKPSRAICRGIAGPAPATSAGPAGTVQPGTAQPAPRRKPSRAYVRFTPVTTTNAPPPNGTVPPRATIPVPRRTPARALWRGIAGAAYVAVPAPRQQYRTAPRRTPSRGLWRGIAGPEPLTYVSVPAPRQQPKPAPRRTLARALWRGIAGPEPLTYVKVPAPRQQYRTPLRRVPSRAYVRFTPVTTINTLGSRQLIISLASMAGTDDYGNTFPQGIQVGSNQVGPQVVIEPSQNGSAAGIGFPMTNPALGFIGNISSEEVDGAGLLLLSGPQLAQGGAQDWVQLQFWSNDGSGTPSRMQFNTIDTNGNVTEAGQLVNGSGWTFEDPVSATDGLTVSGGETVDDLTATGTVTAANMVLDIDGQMTGPNGNGVFGWSETGDYPASTGSSTFGGGAGCSLSTGDFNATAINDLETLQSVANSASALANYIYLVLQDAGIIAGG